MNQPQPHKHTLGPKPNGGRRTATVTARIPSDLKARLATSCKRHDLTLNQALRIAISQYLTLIQRKDT